MIDHDALKNRLERRSNSWKPREGDNRIRILPMHSRFLTTPAPDVAIKYSMHFFRFGGGRTEVTLCLGELRQFCPACAVHRTYAKTDDVALKEAVKEVKASDQYLMNILDIGNIAKGPVSARLVIHLVGTTRRPAHC